MVLKAFTHVKFFISFEIGSDSYFPAQNKELNGFGLISQQKPVFHLCGAKNFVQMNENFFCQPCNAGCPLYIEHS